MMNTTPTQRYIVAKVWASQGMEEFRITTHMALRREDLLIEDEFYGQSLPRFPHTEIQLMNYHEWRWRGPYNIHRSKKNGHSFVRHPGTIHNHEELESVLRLWTTGTVFKKETGRSLNEALTLCGGDFEQTVGYFSRFGIDLVSIDFGDDLLPHA